MSIRQRNAHFTDWAAVCRALNVNTESEARTALESSDNTFYYYVCYIKSTKEIYTHGQFYNCSGASEEILNLINALTEEVAENEEVTAKALSDLNENKASKGEVEIFATSKQDTITDLDSIRTKANNAVQPDQISNFVSTKDLATVATTGDYNDLLNIPDILTTEDVSPVCYTGNYDDLNNKPTIPKEVVEATVSNWGFTKNNGTVTSVKIDNISKSPSNGVVDLGYIHKQRIPFTESTITLQPNVYYKSTNTSMSSFTFRLGSITNTNIINEYFIEFTTSSSGTTVTLPAMVKWVDGVAPTFEAGYTYQISIVDNFGVCVKFA